MNIDIHGWCWLLKRWTGRRSKKKVIISTSGRAC